MHQPPPRRAPRDLLPTLYRFGGGDACTEKACTRRFWDDTRATRERREASRRACTSQSVTPLVLCDEDERFSPAPEARESVIRAVRSIIFFFAAQRDRPIVRYLSYWLTAEKLSIGRIMASKHGKRVQYREAERNRRTVASVKSGAFCFRGGSLR